MAENVTIKHVQTRPEYDPYKNRQATQTVLWLVPDERLCAVNQEEQTGSTTFDRWHNRELTHILDGHPDPEMVRQVLDESMDLLAAVCDGYESVWNGHNHVGRYSADADEAWNVVCTRLNQLDPDYWQYWDAGDWLDPLRGQRFDGSTTDEELAALAAEMKTVAEDDHVVLSEDILEWLTETRNWMRSEQD